jgi:hypothetical protein
MEAGTEPLQGMPAHKKQVTGQLAPAISREYLTGNRCRERRAESHIAVMVRRSCLLPSPNSLFRRVFGGKFSISSRSFQKRLEQGVAR